MYSASLAGLARSVLVVNPKQMRCRTFVFNGFPIRAGSNPSCPYTKFADASMSPPFFIRSESTSVIRIFTI